MIERAKIITEQALALPREEQEAIYRALGESLGKPDIMVDDARYHAVIRLSAEDQQRFAEALIAPAPLTRPWSARFHAIAASFHEIAFMVEPCIFKS